MLVDPRSLWNRLRRLFAFSSRTIAFAVLSLAMLSLTTAAMRPASAQTIVSLHDFGLSPDGDSPTGPLALAADGSFVGTTEFGGANGTGCVYDITPGGVETVLYSFSARTGTDLTNTDGALPMSGVILGADGNYYGCTTAGGASGFGTIFQLSPSGVFTTLINSDGSNGSSPMGLVESSTAGTFYGTTSIGGDNNTGTVFEMVVTTVSTTVGTITTATSTAIETPLYSFSALDTSGNNADGAYPMAAPTIGSDGNLYGTTTGGGNAGGSGLTNGETIGGTVWQLTTADAVFTVLHTFSALDGNSFNTDGTRPQAALTQITDGSFVGSCKDGGANGTGTMFDVTATGTYTLLHTFGAVTSVSGAPAVNPDGVSPATKAIQLASGVIYGACSEGGTAGYGTVFDYTPAVAATGTTAATAAGFATVYTFGSQSSAVQDGNSPLGGFGEDAAGNLYGTTVEGGMYEGFAGSASGGTFFELPLAAPGTATVPIVTSISPTSALAGSAAFTVAVSGTGFDSTSVVYWRVTAALTEALATTFVSSTELTAVVPASLVGIDATLNVGTSETHAVTVLNIDTGVASVASSRSTFTVNPSTATPPSIKTLTPASVTAGSTATVLTIAGTHFFTGDTVSVNGTALTPTSVTATQVTVSIPASLLVKSQGLSVTVSSSAGTSNALTLTVSPVTTFSGGLQLISLPYDYTGVALSSTFGYSDPKLAVWNAATDAYAVTPVSPADAIRLGRGYWIRFPTDTSVLLAGTPATAGSAFSISLEKGWNMVGDPFLTTAPGTGITVTDAEGVPYSFADAASAGIINSSTYSYDPGSNAYILETTGDLQPFVGYWMYADAACTLSVNGS